LPSLLGEGHIERVLEHNPDESEDNALVRTKVGNWLGRAMYPLNMNFSPPACSHNIDSCEVSAHVHQSPHQVVEISRFPTYIAKAALRFDGLLVLGQMTLKDDDAPYVHTAKRKARGMSTSTTGTIDYSTTQGHPVPNVLAACTKSRAC
jgi:hypothetical protein